MRQGSRLNYTFGVFGGVLCAVAAAQTPTVSLEARSVNDVVIPGGPVSSVNAMPGDVIEVVFRVRDWSVTPTTRLKGWQTSLEYDSCRSGGAGNVEPALYRETTDTCNFCFGTAPSTSPPINCMGGDNSGNLLIDITDPTFLHFGLNPFTSVDATSCDYRWAGAVLNGAAAPLSTPGVRRYLGTTWLVVSNDASGTFTVAPQSDPDNGCLLRNQNDVAITPVALESLTIVTPAVGVPSIVSSTPPNGAIDARQPHPINNAAMRQGYNTIVLTLSGSAAGLTPANFVVTHEPVGGTVPTVMSVVPSGNNATLTLSAIIQPGRWTRITMPANGSSTRIGFLPADVNADRTAGPVDILKLIDFLNGLPPAYPIYQTDTDRSNVANPSDILQVINLLNGADQFDVWNGVTLPP